MKKEYINLTEDEIAVFKREGKKISQNLGMINNLINKGELNEELKNNILKVIQFSLNEVNEALHLSNEKSDVEKDIEMSMIKEYQFKIKQLEESIKSKEQISNVIIPTKMLFEKINKWWKTEGFNYIRTESLTSSCYIDLELSILLESYSVMYSKKPETARKMQQTQKIYLIEKGFEFKTNDSKSYLIDNDNNRKLLLSLIKESFPSAKVWNINNHLAECNEEQFFAIDSLKLTILDVLDVERLIVDEKDFMLE